MNRPVFTLLIVKPDEVKACTFDELTAAVMAARTAAMELARDDTFGPLYSRAVKESDIQGQTSVCLYAPNWRVLMSWWWQRR